LTRKQLDSNVKGWRNTAVSIEWYRDLAIVILGLGVTLVAIFIAILALMLYRKVKPTLDAAKATVRRIDNMTSCVEEEISHPLAQLASFLQGARQVTGFFGGFSRRKKEG
jgi:hypothetical protein